MIDYNQYYSCTCKVKKRQLISENEYSKIIGFEWIEVYATKQSMAIIYLNSAMQHQSVIDV